MSRQERVAQAIKEEIGSIIHGKLKDPRLGFVTVTRVELTADLRYAKVFYSILGSQKEEEQSNEALRDSLGFIRRLIAQRINLRFAPEIILKQDKSGEYSTHIQNILNEIKELEIESRKGRKGYKRK